MFSLQVCSKLAAFEGVRNTFLTPSGGLTTAPYQPPGPPCFFKKSGRRFSFRAAFRSTERFLTARDKGSLIFFHATFPFAC